MTASNTNLATLGYVRILMAHYFGIETTGPHLQSRKGSEISRRGRIYTRNSNCYDIYVRMKSLRKFQAVVNFVIVRKKLRLGRFLARGFIT